MSACRPAPTSVGPVKPTVVNTAQWPDASDPFVLPENGRYYVFASDTFWGGEFRMPIRVVDDLDRVYTPDEWAAATIEGMPQPPAWSARDKVFWAPTVARAANGRYVAFFTADRRNPPNPASRQCIGRAIATRPEGPYVAEAGPFTCGMHGVGGAIDPNLFRAPDGQWYLHATFGDTDYNVWAFGLDANLDQSRDVYGLGRYWPAPVFWRSQKWEGYVMENPAMAYDGASQSYLLAYSAGDFWWRPNHTTGLARCSAPLGLCVANPEGPWLAKSDEGSGPGGLSFFSDFDGSLKAVHASWPPGFEGSAPRRATVASVANLATGLTLVPIATPPTTTKSTTSSSTTSTTTLP